jgi:uncharacterized protein YecE (DUF72 family)
VRMDQLASEAADLSGKPMGANLWIGCSGWYYSHWTGVFYPEAMDRSEWLSYYARQFSSLEINSTFYHLPRRKAVERWFSETPDEFCFVVKGSRTITHYKKLVDVGEELDALMMQTAPLSYKLKLLLWQFPPYFKYSPASFHVLAGFCRQLSEIEHKSVFEFRDASWLNQDVADLFRLTGFGLVKSDYAGSEKLWDVPDTGDVIYMRMHGEHGDYASSYTDSHLTELAGWIAGRRSDPAIRDIFVMFNNDYAASSVRNAQKLRDFLAG